MMMNRDNLSALVMAIGVVSLIVGFAVYFNSPELNKVTGSGQGGGTTNFIPATTQVVQEGGNDSTTIKKAQFSIDKSQFRKAPEFEKITGFINTKPISLADLAMDGHRWRRHLKAPITFVTCIQQCVHVITQATKEI